MSQSLSRLSTHLIFSTKERFPFLKEAQIRTDMHGYLAKVLRSHDCETLIVVGTSDHIHALFDLSRRYCIATVVKEIKRTSSAWVKGVSLSCKEISLAEWLWSIFRESVRSRSRLQIYRKSRATSS